MADCLGVDVANDRPVGYLTTVQRGYGALHQAERKRLLPLAYGSLCPLCGELMTKSQRLDLDHSDPESRFIGQPGDRIVHSICNRREGGRRGNAAPSRSIRPCQTCGKEFRGRRGSLTCSRACWQVLRRNLYPPSPKQKMRKARENRPCALCSTPTTRRLYCSEACYREANARQNRDRYRAKIGLPVDPDEPTSRWRKRDATPLRPMQQDLRSEAQGVPVLF